MAALVLKDFFSFAPSAGRAGGSSTDPDIREAARAGKGLKVTFAASHAGMVNGNNVMYSPAGMKDNSHTWVWPQRRAIQVHHDDHADPIGRVIGARYAGYGEAQVGEGQSDALRLFSDSIKLTRDNVVEIAKALEDSKVLGAKDWRGVGELLLDGIVTDSDAVEKILDGRYQGVSITQRPQQAFCSLCGQDWVADGPCEHERGERDKETGRRMYLVVGDTDYIEISYVNTPADKHAMGLAAQPIENASGAPAQFDEENKDSDFISRDMQTTMFFQLVDSLDEETEMTQGNKTRGDGVKPEEQDAQDPVEDVTDPEPAAEETPPEADSEDPTETEQDSEDPVEQDAKSTDDGDTPSDETPPAEQAPEVTVEEALKCLFEDGNLTAEMCDLLFDAMEELVEEDAKLSTEKRKSLPSESFCGPNRSFPVNDCAHYTAAKRLLSRYKGPGDKSSILSCINRKGKALGCASSKDEDQRDELEGAGAVATMKLTDASDDVLSQLLLDAEKEMAKRGLRAERKCDNCEDLQTRIDRFEAEVPELQDTVKILREEWKAVTGEHIASEDAHAATLADYEASLRSSVLISVLLTDKDTNEEDAKAKVDAMTFEDLKKIAKETDLSEVISFVRSGMAREPEGTVTVEDAEPEEQTTPDPVANLAESLVNLQRDHGTNYATTVMYDWMRVGKLPEDFTLDKAFELVAK